MSKVETYREHLRQMCDWESFLLAESHLPGPRGNLELARAAADEGDATQFARWLAVGPGEGPTNTPATPGTAMISSTFSTARPDSIWTITEMWSEAFSR